MNKINDAIKRAIELREGSFDVIEYDKVCNDPKVRVIEIDDFFELSIEKSCDLACTEFNLNENDSKKVLTQVKNIIDNEYLDRDNEPGAMVKMINEGCIRFSTNWSYNDVERHLNAQWVKYQVQSRYVITYDIETAFIDIEKPRDARELKLSMGIVLDSIVNYFLFNVDGTTNDKANVPDGDELFVFNPRCFY